MQIELYQMIIHQLEILIQNYALTDNVFLIKKDSQLIGFELANKEEPMTARPGDLVEYSTILELYADIKKILGYKDRSILLKALRLSNKLTQSDVANIIGRTKQEIHRWENKYNPPKIVIDKLIEYLKIKAD